ncbi:hypothetical protein BBP40_012241 [Aspergillus hancockii]|nr:hypothetical protein BBP40_012241 [Aspergillus hancockii]
MASSWVPPGNYEKKGYQERLVDEIVYRYYRIDQPNTVLRDILRDTEQSSLLLSALRRQISLIKCRSQTFNDGQITTYDRALLKLSRNGENLTDMGALELYLNEYLGVVPIFPATQSQGILAQRLKLESVLRKAAAPGTQPETIVGRKEQPQIKSEPIQPRYGPKDCDDRYYMDSADSSIRSTSDVQQVSDRVTRLLDIYRHAKDEYYTALQTDGYVSLEAARFLRDTAENALRYLHANGLSDHTAVPDLEQVFTISRDKATQLTGGRKRHFDEDTDRRPDRHPRKKKRSRGGDSYRPKG